MMPCWTGVNTCAETSLGCLRKLGWVIKVLAGSGPLPSQMFGWIRSMKPTEDSTGTSALPQPTSIYPFTALITPALTYSVITPLHTAPTLYCNLPYSCSAITSSDWIIGRHLQHKVQTSSIFSNHTSNLPKKGVWDEMWAQCHAIHFLSVSIASEESCIYCIGPNKRPSWS